MSVLIAQAVALTPREALSGIFGSISVASWVFLLVPQLIENYRLQSAHGISLLFLLVWFVGDITNLAGALWAQLVPTVIVTAIYFCFADLILITQCVYYNTLSARKERRRFTRSASVGTADTVETEGEEEPLLSRHESNQSAASLGLPGSHKRRRKSSTASGLSARGNGRSDSLTKIAEEPALASSSSGREWLKNVGAILLVSLIGTLGWIVAYKSHAWKPAPAPSSNHGLAVFSNSQTPLGASILGYISAVCYLGARVPQIVKNWRDKSCAGLSLLFFLLSLLGNLSYGAGILFHSTENAYVVTNLPWLIGSLGTMFEDVMIFAQFHIYGDREKDEAIEE